MLMGGASEILVLENFEQTLSYNWFKAFSWNAPLILLQGLSAAKDIFKLHCHHCNNVKNVPRLVSCCQMSPSLDWFVSLIRAWNQNLMRISLQACSRNCHADRRRCVKHVLQCLSKYCTQDSNGWDNRYTMKNTENLKSRRQRWHGFHVADKIAAQCKLFPEQSRIKGTCHTLKFSQS